MSKKKTAIIVVAVIIVAAAAAGGLWLWLSGKAGGSSNGDKVYVESVASLTNVSTGVQNRYSGVVEPQQSWEVKKNPEKTVKEVFVKEGDQVEVGTPLFEYDTESIMDEIAQDKLELEGIDNEISDYYNQISALEAERNTVSEDEKFQYTTEIQSIQTSIKQSEYSRESKKAEIEKKEEALDHAVVNSEIAGIIKSISENGYDQYTGEELPFMTVLATGAYRVKGTINEQNVWTIAVGSPVLLRSRIDEAQTWTGTITEVDTNNEVTNNNNNGYYEGSSGETATKYPFYIELDNADGLILGQHIYIEMDMEQSEEKEGLWLYESYIVTDDTGSFVWADNGKNKLEKRAVELGEYDAEMGMYQILSGITEKDYIAFPMASMYEGVTTVTDAAEVDYTSPMYMEEDGAMDDGMLEDGAMDDGMLDDGMLEDGAMDDGMEEDGAMDDGSAEEDAAEPEVSE